MTETIEIPADVKDNSTHSIRIQWRSTRDAQPDEIESGRRYLDVLGYTLYEWDDIDRTGTRVTLHRFVNCEGQTVDLFATYYFTRVACRYDDAHYAERFVDEGDGNGPIPMCGYHLYVSRRSARRDRRTIAESELLRIGQH